MAGMMMRVGASRIVIRMLNRYFCHPADGLARCGTDGSDFDCPVFSPDLLDAQAGTSDISSPPCLPGCFRLERSPGGACTRWKSAALSRRTRKPAIAPPAIGINQIRAVPVGALGSGTPRAVFLA